MQSKEMDTFIGSLVKLQLQIKGMVDNDVQMPQNGMLKKEAEEIEKNSKTDDISALKAVSS